MADPSRPLKVLELYSGIGGMHWALKESNVEFEISMAVDINTTANRIYKENFPDAPLSCFGIEKLTLKQLEKLSVDAILMSPPCQPFTRKGKKRDCEDVRTQSFLHILGLLSQLERKPSYLLVENVKGFEVSQARDQLIQCLDNTAYTWQEFLLTPLQFGIPNCRLRYYLLAKWGQDFVFPVSKEILTTMPSCHSNTETTGTKENSQCGVVSPSIDCLAPSSKKIFSTCGDVESVPSQESETNDTSCPDTLGTNFAEQHSCSTQSDSSTNDAVENKQIYSNVDDSVTSPTNITKQIHGDVYNDRNTFRKHLKRKRLDDEPGFNSEELEAFKEAGRSMRFCGEDDEDILAADGRFLWEFMENCGDFEDYLLTNKELRLFHIMDIVFPALRKSTCFTKRYGHYVDAAGSVVQMTTDVEAVRAASSLKAQVVEKKNRETWGQAELGVVRALRLRYFTPREVANLLCFPQELVLPPDLPKVQLYRVLGNSLNVHVVARLIDLMTQHSRPTNKT